jgi:hypothetical protein
MFLDIFSGAIVNFEIFPLVRATAPVYDAPDTVVVVLGERSA